MTHQKAAFEVIPAIDLLGGQAVRLSQGRYDEATIYDANPASVAERFAKPFSFIHDGTYTITVPQEGEGAAPKTLEGKAEYTYQRLN